MKTRQQRLAEERAGQPASPQQQLAEKARGPRRTRAKKPRAGKVSASSPAPVVESRQTGTVAAGSIAPAAQSAVSGEAQALLHVWVDAGPEATASGRPVDDPTLELAIPSALVPKLLAFIATCNQVEPQLQETSRMAPDTTPARIETAFQQNSHSIQSPCIGQPIHTMSKSVQSQTAGSGSTGRKKRAFSRKPLLPLSTNLKAQPVPSSPDVLTTVDIPAIFREKSHLPTYTVDGTALYGPMTTSAPGLIASSKDQKMSQQLDDEADANEDSDMDDISERCSITSHLAESSVQEAMQSNQEPTPETPRGSGWGLGNLIQSARYSVTRRFGFSPLTPISERSEPTPQTQTETSAPTQPKKKNPIQTSARALRAKNRRHSDSVAEPVKPITISPNQRVQLSRTKKANPASGSTEATATEEENSPATRLIHRDQEEARQAQSGESDMTPTIRFPSQSLDRMASKRKRWRSSDTIPNPKGKSYGLGEAEFYGNSEEDDVMGQQPGKLRRTGDLEDFSHQVAGNPGRARPYTGSMFEKSTTEYNGGNVFREYEAARKTEEATAKVTNRGQSSPKKVPIPITNSAGTFKVPSPGDSDWSNSESEEEVFTTGLEDVTTVHNRDWELELAVPALFRSKLPKPQQVIKSAAQSEALRKARDKALKHKPRNPSTLSRSSRTYSSSPVPNEEETKRESGAQAAAEPSTVSKPEPIGSSKFNAYEEWCKTAPPAVTAALGRMEVDPNLAGNAFEEALDNPGPTGHAKFNAYEEWCKTASPAVAVALGKMAVDPNLAGDAFKWGLDNFTTSEMGANQEVA